MTDFFLLPFFPEQAQEISDLIGRVLLEVNIKNYPREALERFAEYYSAETVLELALRGQMFVALDGDSVAGYIGSQSVLDEADMMNVAVHPDYRRQGIGEKLVLALAQALTEKGIRGLMLEVRESNVPAIALYEKLGFRQVGLRKNYYRAPKENALIMRKELSL